MGGLRDRASLQSENARLLQPGQSLGWSRGEYLLELRVPYLLKRGRPARISAEHVEREETRIDHDQNLGRSQDGVKGSRVCDTAHIN